MTAQTSTPGESPPSPGPAPRAPSRRAFLISAAAVTVLVIVLSVGIGGAIRHAITRHSLIGELFASMMLVIEALLLFGLWLLWRSRTKSFALERSAHDTATRVAEMFAGDADPALLLTIGGRIEAANAAARRLLGYDANELLGRCIMNLFDPGEERDFKACIGPIDGRLGWPYLSDRTARHRDGGTIPIDIALGVIDLPDGPHVLMMMRDIAERKSVERLKDEFLATISHELRTPLTSVIGALGLLRKGTAGALPEAADRLVEIAENNSRRLIRLVNDLLDIEKSGSGRMRFDRAPIDLVHVADIAVEAALGLASERGVGIEIVAEKRPLTVMGDRDRLLQVLANLLTNAVRVSPDGGRVRVAVALAGGQASVTVDDEGPGVPPEFAGRIFQRFAQASGSVEGGSGLGLAISREIVVAHDGRIWFGRSPQGGARFAFALPLSRQEALRSSRACVLLAEADPAEARRLRELLEAQNIGVEIAESDSAALSAALSGRHDVLVIDVELPAMGGLETLRALRRRAETRALPAVLLSAHGIADAVGGGPALEPAEWIDKPVDPGRLIAAVRRVIVETVRARPTVLHVDDDTDMLEVAAATLAEQGRIVHATSLASARAVIVAQAPDLVVLDLHLPDGSGAALLPDLYRADGSAIPVVLYTAFDVPTEIEQQVDAVLVKSLRSLDALAHVVRRILAVGTQDVRLSA